MSDEANVPSPDGDAHIAAAPADLSAPPPSKKHYPWRRFFARTIDVFYMRHGFLLLSLTLGGALSGAPEKINILGFLAVALAIPVIGDALAWIVWAPIEALLLSRFGTTPAKWLFSIRVVHPDGSLLSFSEAFKRALRVFVQGTGLAIPFVMQIVQLISFFYLMETGTTRWDASAKAEVRHKKWGVFRAIVCTVVVLITLSLMHALNLGVKRALNKVLPEEAPATQQSIPKEAP